MVLKGLIGEEVVLQRVFGGRWSSKAWLGGSGPQRSDWLSVQVVFANLLTRHLRLCGAYF